MTSPLEIGALLVNVAGGLAIFLYGMHKMTEALKIVAGERIKTILSKLTKNRFSAAFAGASITAIIQSSSITTVLVVGFITAGLMSFQQSIGVILGANLGTTITAQIIAFKVTKSALLLIALGFFTEVLAKNQRIKQLGVLSMGLGMLFFGMELMSQATTPLRSYDPFMVLMQNLDNPILGVLIGAVFTALVQSSSATTGIVIVMASQGLLSLESAIALIFGSNIGTCVTAIISAVGKPREAMQAATVHVLFNVIGVLLFVGFIPQFADFIRSISPVSETLNGVSLLSADTPRQIANAHTIFNVLNLIIFIGFTTTLAKIALKIVPSKPLEILPGTTPKYLDKMYLDQPAMALDRVKLELGRVGEKLIGMIKDSYPTLTVGTKERIDDLHKRDKEIDALSDAITLYLRKLATANLVEPQPVYLQRYLGVADYLENISDIIDTGLVKESYKRLNNHVKISPQTEQKLSEIYKELFQTAQITLEALLENDHAKAQQVIESKLRFYGLIERTRSHLYVRLKTEQPEHLLVYKIEISAMENFKRIYNQLRNICKLILSSSNDKEPDQVPEIMTESIEKQ